MVSETTDDEDNERPAQRVMQNIHIKTVDGQHAEIAQDQRI